jgi:hypothetical protein
VAVAMRAYLLKIGIEEFKSVEKKEDGNNTPQFSFTSQLGLGQYTHIDEIPSPRSIHDTLRSSRKLRSFHTNDTLIRQQRHAPAFRFERHPDSTFQPPHELHTERISKCSMRDDGRALEETGGSYPFGAVYDLSGEDERTWGNVFA